MPLFQADTFQTENLGVFIDYANPLAYLRIFLGSFTDCLESAYIT